jgi:selenocysteine lyase/cysteine desulfurase
VGWHSVVGSYNSFQHEFRLKESAQRWEGGSFNMPGLLGFGASVGLFLELGPAVMSRRILDVASGVRELAARAGWTVYGSRRAEERSAIVVVERHGVDPDEAARELRRQGIVVSCRRGRLRVSPHVYNNQEDLGRLRAGLERLR